MKPKGKRFEQNAGRRTAMATIGEKRQQRARDC